MSHRENKESTVNKDTDLQRIEDILKLMKDNDLVEVEISHGSDKILLKRANSAMPAMAAMPFMGHHAPVAHSANPAAPVAEVKKGNFVEIKSPIVGTFYSQPSPDSPPYVENGGHVGQQTVVCIIEAMKVMNEIKAETSGTIVEIMVKNGQAVEYGQPLFRVKPD